MELWYVINREYLSYKHFTSPISRIATRWTNLGQLIYRLTKKSAPIDMLKAQYLGDRYRKDIREEKLEKIINKY